LIGVTSLIYYICRLIAVDICTGVGPVDVANKAAGTAPLEQIECREATYGIRNISNESADRET
jgi:hypothetical protein